MNNAKRNIAIAFSVIFICLVLFAGCLIVAEHQHECIGENCNICSVIDAAQELLGGMMLLAIASILFVVLFKFGFNYLLVSFKNFLFTTPILLKVKLSD